MSIPPEYNLLLDAVAPKRAPRVDHREWTPEQWAEALRVAEWHRLSPVLFCHLQAAGDTPADVYRELERAYLENAARNMYVGAAMRGAVAALTAADVPVMLLKGAALVETCYPDPGQREMLDLDMLVPRARVDAGSNALQALGYSPDAEGAEGPQHLRLEHHHDAPLVGDQQVLAIELHRHITVAGEGAKFDINELWRRARPAPSGAHLLPSAEDLLLHVCMHFTRNRIGGSFRRRQTGGALAQICDIARIVEHQAVQWPQLASTSRRYGLDTRVFLALFAATALGVPIPTSALAELCPPGFNPELGRRLVRLRVLRSDDRLPVRSVRWMVAPSRDVLARGWNADPTTRLSLAQAYVRRARENAPLARSALRRPWTLVQDRRLNGEIYALEDDG